MRVTDLEISVRDKTILGPVSVEFGVGEWTAVVGPNGAGKTTLCNALGGLIRPSQGEVEVNQRIGVLAQSPPRAAGLTALEYVLIGATAWGAESDDAINRAREALESCAVDERQMVETLSGGEFRKAGIARLLTLDPEIMILDEPSAGLDPQARIDIFELLDGVRGNKTLLTVMHDLATASQFGERFLVISEGRIVADGSADEVLTSSEFTAAFGASIRLIEVDGKLVPVMIR